MIHTNEMFVCKKSVAVSTVNESEITGERSYDPTEDQLDFTENYG